MTDSFIFYSLFNSPDKSTQQKFIEQKTPKMGCEASNQSSLRIDSPYLIVATLNYGGILNSPLQFFSDSQEEERQISTIFRQLIPKYVTNFNDKTFKWDVGKIDQKIQKQRYTPIYRSKIGVENNKLIDKNQFQKNWEQYYRLAVGKIKVEPEPTSEQINNMKLFDLLCYHTLLKFLYKIDSLDDTTNQNLDPTPYVKLTQKYFNRSYLNEQKKIEKVQSALSVHSADIFCFQQPTQKFISELKMDHRFYVYQQQPECSMLLIRKQSFKNINDQNYLKNILTQKQYKELNWDGDTSFIVCDKYIIISGHLSSKKQKNQKQVKQMKASLNLLRQKCPDYDVIVGADTNSFVNSKDIENFQIFPNLNTEFTTRKKRTFVQPQFNKADSVNQQCKDQIFSTLKMAKKQIVTIQNEEVDTQKSSKILLPTEKHPFDHFMLLCTLQKRKN